MSVLLLWLHQYDFYLVAILPLACDSLPISLCLFIWISICGLIHVPVAISYWLFDCINMFLASACYKVMVLMLFSNGRRHTAVRMEVGVANVQFICTNYTTHPRNTRHIIWHLYEFLYAHSLLKHYKSIFRLRNCK